MNILLPLCAALAAALPCEALCRLPKAAPWGRARIAGALGLALALFLVLFWITLRPQFSALGVWAGLLALALTNNAKLAALHEPLLADDRAELLQVATHPGLYLPFLTRIQALGLVCAALAVVAALLLDAPVVLPLLPQGPAGLALRLLLGAAAVLAGWSLLMPGLLPRLHKALCLRPDEDLARLGFFGAFSVSLLASWDPAPRRALRAAPGPWPPLCAGSRPHILAVQAEAFYDVGRPHPELGYLLPGLAGLRLDSAQVSPLEVPAFGANTIRTEFSFLSGLAPQALGLEQFQPYARLARRPLDSLAWRLREEGYRTLCLHPNSGAFYGRKRVLPNLGFQDFLDLKRLGPLERFGPHVADLALAEYALGLLRASKEPLFLFLVSMENHSPWLPGRLDAAQLTGIPERLGGQPLGFDTRCYLRHLQNSDAMLQTLAAGLGDLGDGALCFFGDHQPNLPELWSPRAPGSPPDTRSDALLWRPGQRLAIQAPQPCHAHDLPLALMRLAGLVDHGEPRGA